MKYAEKHREADEDQIVLGYVCQAERLDLMWLLWESGQWCDRCSQKVTLALETGLGRGQAGVEADGPVRRRAVEKRAGPLGGEDSRNSWGLRCGRGKDGEQSSRSPRFGDGGARPRAWRRTAHVDGSCSMLASWLDPWVRGGKRGCVCWMVNTVRQAMVHLCSCFEAVVLWLSTRLDSSF